MKNKKIYRKEARQTTTTIEYNRNNKEINNLIYLIQHSNNLLLISKSKEELINEYEPLIYSIVNRYHTIKLERDDLLQEAYLGFLHAVDTFDPQSKVKLSTYAYRIICQYIEKAINTQSYLITISPYIYNKNKNNNTSYNNFKTTINTEEFEKLYHTSMNPEKIYYYQKKKNSILKLLRILNPRDQIIIKLKFGLDNYNPKTLEDIGKQFNLTKSSISKIIKLSLNKLKKYIESNPNSPISLLNK